MRTVSSSNNHSYERASGVPTSDPNRAAFVLAVIIGAALGLLLGLILMPAAGVLSVVVGVVVGALGGALVGKLSLARMRRQSVRDSLLDREIGVIDGDIGGARRT